MTFERTEIISCDLALAKNNELTSPVGLWSYVVAFSLSLFYIATVAPISNLGITFGSFLASVGDETSGISILNGIFNTTVCFTGLVANPLLQNMSYRKVGVLGAAVYFCGAFTSIFVTSLFEVVISFGVLQGFGFGLMMPSMYTAFNQYFVEKRNMMMSISQAVIALITIAFPPLLKFLMGRYGFCGTIAVLAALSLNCIPAMLTLQPVKWHLKKKQIGIVEIENQIPLLCNKSLEETPKPDSNPETVSESKLSEYKNSLVKAENLEVDTDKNSKKLSFWKSISKSLDLGLFKDPVYVNIAMGLSFSITSDLTFIAVLPLLLVDAGCNGQQLTIIMMVYFVSDLIGRITLSILSAVINVKSRHWFLFGALFSAIFHIAFVMSDFYWWLVPISAILGFLRAFIQIPLPLVMAEAYPKQFVTAFSFYMVLCGFIALGCGLLNSLIKTLTHSDIMVVHVLTIIYLLCAIPWIIEMIYLKYFPRK